MSTPAFHEIAIGDVMWVVSSGGIVRHFGEAKVVKLTPTQIVTERRGYPGAERFSRNDWQRIPYDPPARLQVERPEETPRMQPTFAQKKLDAARSGDAA